MKYFIFIFLILFSFLLFSSEPQIIGFSDDGKFFAFFYETDDQMGNMFSELKVFSLETKKLTLFLKFSKENGDYKNLEDIKKIFFEKYGENFNFKKGKEFLKFSGSMEGDSFILSNKLSLGLNVEYQKEKNEYGTYSYTSLIKDRMMGTNSIKGKVIDIYSFYIFEKGFGVAIFKSREDGLEGEFTDYYYPVFVQIKDFELKKDVEGELKFNAEKAKRILDDFFEKNRFYPEDRDNFFRYGKVLINPVDESKDAVYFTTGNLKYNQKYEGTIIIENLTKSNYYNIWYFYNGNIVKTEGVDR